MAADTNDNAKKLTNWVDGLPAAHIQKDSDSLGKTTYWVDGLPYVTVYPASAATKQDTMAVFFWGIG